MCNRISSVVKFLAFLLIAAPTAGLAQEVRPVDRIVAVVNDEVITAFDLEDRMKLVKQQLQERGTPAPPRAALERQLLERMINDRLQLQYAKSLNLKVEDAQLDEAIGRIASQNGLDPMQFRAELVKQGMDFTRFREEIRQEILLGELRQREIESKVNVSDSEIARALEATPAEEQEYQVAHILVRVPEQAGAAEREARLRRAREALAAARANASFAEVAATFSDAPDAMDGGQLGWKSPDQLPEVFRQALAQLQPGGLSPVLQSPNGYHILKLEGVRSKQRAAVVPQLHLRHILLKTDEVVNDAEARRRLEVLKERIENGADFAELARLHSQDGSSAKGGDLGWVSPGETVPEFERAAAALKENEVSAPVQSRFGWHLIQLLGRREQDVSGERRRLSAREAVRERKADEAYDEWLRQLRDSAYVEIRLDE